MTIAAIATIPINPRSTNSEVERSLPSARKTTPSASPSANSPAPSVSPISKFLQPTPSTGIQPLKYPGTWGLFKFFDAGGGKPDGAGGYTLTFPLSNKQTLTVNVKPTTAAGDLFNRSYFNSVKAPDKIK